MARAPSSHPAGWVASKAVAEFPRSLTTKFVVSKVRTREGTEAVQIQIHYTADSGATWHPTSKAVAIPVSMDRAHNIGAAIMRAVKVELPAAEPVP